MKELYIPRGKTVNAVHIEADRIIIKGALNVDGTIKARRIMGDGVLHAGHISANSVVADDIEAGTITARRVAASRAVTATCYLEAGMVKTPKLTTHGYEVEELKAKKVVQLPDGHSGMLWTVLTSELRTAWSALRCWWEERKTPTHDGTVQDAAYEQTEESAAETVDTDWEFERKRLNRVFDLAQGHGFVLRVMTPTEAQSPIGEGLKADIARKNGKAA